MSGVKFNEKPNESTIEPTEIRQTLEAPKQVIKAKKKVVTVKKSAARKKVAPKKK